MSLTTNQVILRLFRLNELQLEIILNSMKTCLSGIDGTRPVTNRPKSKKIKFHISVGTCNKKA